MAEPAQMVYFGPAQVIGAVQKHSFHQRGGGQRAVVLVAVSLLQKQAEARYQRRRLGGAALAVGHQLGFHAAIVSRTPRAEGGYLPAGVGGAHGQGVFRHFELPADISEVGNALVSAAGASQGTGIARRENVQQRRKLLALPVVFLRLHAVIVLDTNPVGMILHRYADLGQLLAIIGQQAGKIGGSQPHGRCHAPAERVRVAGSADERGHTRGVVRGRARKSTGRGHPAPQVDIVRVKRLLLYRNREALPPELRKTGVQRRNSVDR